MAQIVRTTNELINNALYLIGELGVGETPDAYMLSTGIELINEVLDKFDSDGITIPYLTTLNFNMFPGQDTYSISDMIIGADVVADRILDLSFANYIVPTTGNTNLVYPLNIISKANYWNVIRQSNLQARPGFIFLNKQPQASFVTLYPVPDQPYPCILQVKSMLNSVVPYGDLGELPPNCYGLLKYAIARKFLSYYPSANWPQTSEEEYQEYYSMFKNTNETDMTIRPSQILSSPEPFYWPNILSY